MQTGPKLAEIRLFKENPGWLPVLEFGGRKIEKAGLLPFLILFHSFHPIGSSYFSSKKFQYRWSAGWLAMHIIIATTGHPTGLSSRPSVAKTAKKLPDADINGLKFDED